MVDGQLKNSLDEKCADFTKGWESLRLKAYRIVIGENIDIWTIGYGTTKGVYKGMVITPEQAENFLMNDLRLSIFHISYYTKVPLNDNQIISLTDLIYNIGSQAFYNSTLRMKLNRGEYQNAADQFLRWNKFKGLPCRGLTRRREAERALFLQ